MKDNNVANKDTKTTKEDLFATFLIEKFKLYRNDVDWKASQSSWADYLGVNTSTLSTWMLGRRLPSGENIHLLADKLGWEVYDILDEPRRMPDNPKIQIIVGMFYHLSPSDQEKVVEYAEKLATSK